MINWLKNNAFVIFVIVVFMLIALPIFYSTTNFNLSVREQYGSVEEYLKSKSRYIQNFDPTMAGSNTRVLITEKKDIYVITFNEQSNHYLTKTIAIDLILAADLLDPLAGIKDIDDYNFIKQALNEANANQFKNCYMEAIGSYVKIVSPEKAIIPRGELDRVSNNSLKRTINAFNFLDKYIWSEENE